MRSFSHGLQRQGSADAGRSMRAISGRVVPIPTVTISVVEHRATGKRSGWPHASTPRKGTQEDQFPNSMRDRSTAAHRSMRCSAVPRLVLAGIHPVRNHSCDD